MNIRVPFNTLLVCGILVWAACFEAVGESPAESLLRTAENKKRLELIGEAARLYGFAKDELFNGIRVRLKGAPSEIVPAVIVIECLGDKAGMLLPDLLTTLDSVDPKVRSHVCAAIGSMGGAAESAVPALIWRLKDSEPDVRRLSAGALGQIRRRPDIVLPALIKAFDDSERGVQSAAAAAVGYHDPSVVSEYLPDLLARLKDGPEQSKGWIAEALGYLKLAPDIVVPVLLQEMREAAGDQRRLLISSLGRFGENAVSAAPDLVDVLDNDPDLIVRCEVVNALGKMGEGSPEVLAALLRCLLIKESAGLVEAARNALVTLMKRDQTPGRRMLERLHACMDEAVDADLRAAVEQALNRNGSNDQAGLHLRSAGFEIQAGPVSEADIRRYEAGAKEGMAIDQYELGTVLLGRGRNASEWKRAFDLVAKAAEQGWMEARYTLGVLYVTGTGIDRDYQKARACFEAALAARMPDADYSLGLMYMRGLGVETNQSIAFEHFKRAASAGHAAAAALVGESYRVGRGTNVDVAEAVRWYRRAAENNHAEAQYALASALMSGAVGEKDSTEAIGWFQAAAKEGSADAQNDLGYIYMEGFDGINPDYRRAKCWITWAAAAGHSRGLLNLGKLYEYGTGVPIKSTIARRLYYKSESRRRAAN